MAITNTDEFTVYDTFKTSGIVTSDTFNGWRKKTNGIINELDRIGNLTTNITSLQLSLGAPTWTTAGALSTYNNGAGSFTASSIKVGGTATTAATGAVNALSLAVGTNNTQFTVTNAGAITHSSIRGGNITINTGGPTLYFQDIDGRASMVRVDASKFYILRAVGGTPDGTNSTTWETDFFPMEIDLNTKSAIFGGTITTGGLYNPTGKLISWKNSQTNVESSGIVSASSTGNSTIAFDCSESSGAMIRHVRGGNGVEIVDNATTPAYANLRSSRLIVSSTPALETAGIPTIGGINLQGFGGNNYIFGTLLDGASDTLANIKINSWWGVGFGPTISNQTIPSGQNAVYINCRNGDLTARGNVTAATPTASTHVTTKGYVDGMFTYGTPSISVPVGGTVSFFEFTSIPAAVKRITIMLNNVSTNGTNQLSIVLADSGGYETSGYQSSVSFDAGRFGITEGFAITENTTATHAYSGCVTLNRFRPAPGVETWILTGTVFTANNNYVHSSGGIKTLSGILNRIKITTVSEVNVFDSGSANIMYEY